MPMKIDPYMKRPAPYAGRGAIIVYGHRHSCLFRPDIGSQTGYDPVNLIVSKILESATCRWRRARNFLASGGSIFETMKRIEIQRVAVAA